MIHQPHFLPWPGYLARCLAVDKLVLLDNVKFKGSHYQQRTKFFDIRGFETWLTLPIARETRSSLLSDVRIADNFNLSRWQRRFEEAYRGFNDFAMIWNELRLAIQRSSPMLSDVNVDTLMHLLKLLASAADKAVPDMSLASSLEVSINRTQRLADICQSLRITHLVMGWDALASHSVEVLRRSDLVLVGHQYYGRPDRAPRPGVTVLDDIFRLGVGPAANRLLEDYMFVDLSDR